MTSIKTTIMKTKLPDSIKTVEEAKVFLTELHNNGESYHPEDSPHDIAWAEGVEPPTHEECEKLYRLMDDIYNLPGNTGEQFDPCGFYLDLLYPPPSVEIVNSETSIKSIETRHTGGNIYNDVVTLKGGTIIVIGQGAICVYKDEKHEENNEEIGHVYY